MSADRITLERTRPPRPDRRLCGLFAATGLVFATLACGGDDNRDSITVFAASSLSDVLESAADEFTEATGREVRLSVAGSSALRLQLDEGADADVFIPADPAQLELLVDPPTDAVVVATNTVVVAYGADSPARTLSEFADDDLLLGACAPQVPCGRYAQVAFDVAGVTAALDTEEPDVRSVASKVADGDLDAGIVYATDVAADSRLAFTALPDDVQAAVSVTYVAATMNDGAGGQEFVDFLLTAYGQATFADAGFGAP